MIPRLHVVTDDAVLADPSFPETAVALARALGDDLALHVRGHATAARRLHDLVAGLERAFDGTGARLLVADRIDVALATDRAGVRLGERSIPVTAARRLVGDRTLASSVHGVSEAEAASRDGTDLLVVGTIWPTASHPGRPGAGTARIAEVCARVRVPVVAIGGVTPERAREARVAGAAGVAVLRGVWAAGDPVAAARTYLAAMDGAAERAGAGEGARR